MKYERLRNLREDRDLTQTQIAQYLHTTQRTYSHYENGDRNIPLETLMQLADFYNTSIDYLVGRTDIAQPYPTTKKVTKKSKAPGKHNINISRGLLCSEPLSAILSAFFVLELHCLHFFVKTFHTSIRIVNNLRTLPQLIGNFFTRLTVCFITDLML